MRAKSRLQFSSSHALRILTFGAPENPKKVLACCHFLIRDLLLNETFIFKSDFEGEKNFKHSK